MRVCSYETAAGPQPGLIDSDTVYRLQGDLFAGEFQRGERVGPLAAFQLLPPAQPSKIICVGRNYVAHAEEFGNQPPAEPVLFFKPPSSLIGHRQAVKLMPENGRVDHESEMAVVIGRGGRFLTEEEAFDHILGYTCANDISDRDFQRNDLQWTRAKGFDTFCSLGPWLETDLDVSDLSVQCRVNGELKQDGRTSLMLFPVPRLLAYISRIMTLVPGDVILTGTPSGVSPIQPGDEVEVFVEGIGTLSNPVKRL